MHSKSCRQGKSWQETVVYSNANHRHYSSHNCVAFTLAIYQIQQPQTADTQTSISRPSSFVLKTCTSRRVADRSSKIFPPENVLLSTTLDALHHNPSFNPPLPYASNSNPSNCPTANIALHSPPTRRPCFKQTHPHQKPD